MGFVREAKVYNLVWSDDELAGLEVKARAAGFATYRRIAELATVQIAWPPTAEDLVRVDDLHEAFGAQLVSWNLEEAEGVPVPATVEGLRSQDPELTLAIILAWMTAVAGVPEAKQEDLDELLESMPMDVLTP